MNISLDGSTVIFDNGKKSKCVQVDGNIVRVFAPDAVPDCLVKLLFTPRPVELTGEHIFVGGYSLSFDGELFLTIRDKKGRVVYSDYTGDDKVYEENKDFSLAALEGHKTQGIPLDFKTQISIALGKKDRVYGLGDKAAAMDRRGYRYVQWNSDDPSQHNETYKSLYKSINYALVAGDNGCYGLFYPDPHRAVFDLGAYNEDFMYIGSVKGEYDYYIILGDEPKDITREYTRLVGRPLLPRLKMLGYQQSRWSYASQAEVEELVGNFVKNDIPLDYVHLDIDYMDGYRVYTVDKSRFPDIAAMAGRLGEHGVELVAIVDPGVKYDEEYFVYKELERAAGLATYRGEVYHNAVWPGDSVYPDYFNNNAAELITRFTADFMQSTGVTGIWCDMNEPASFNGPLPDDVMFGSYPHERVHNLYGDYMVRAISKAFDIAGKRRYVITRACFATSSPYTTVWNGDNQSLWAHLRVSLAQIATMNICGFPLDGCDIGGFGNECTKELLIRWIQANIFSPFLRNHSSLHTRSQEPYAFDEQTLDVYKKMLRLRYDLAPYMYDLCYNAHLTGEPVVRPLFYSYPNDKNCARISDEITVGGSILLAPVLDAGAISRSVYFPNGKWLDWWGSGVHAQGLEAVDMPIDSVGLYVRRDSIIPMYSGLNNLSKKPTELIVWLGGGRAEYINYEDDGVSADEKYNMYKMSFNGKRFRLKTIRREYDSDYKKLTLVLGGKKVSVPFGYDIDIEL